jgi:hypothetical protein
LTPRCLTPQSRGQSAASRTLPLTSNVRRQRMPWLKVAKLLWAFPCSAVGLIVSAVPLLLGSSSKWSAGALEVTYRPSLAACGKLARDIPSEPSCSGMSSLLSRSKNLWSSALMNGSTSSSTKHGGRCSSWHIQRPVFGSCSTGAARTGITTLKFRHVSEVMKFTSHAPAPNPSVKGTSRKRAAPYVER